MISAIGCSIWSCVYECRRVECALTSPMRPECGIFLMCCMARVNCFVVRGCAVFRRYINICNSDVFSFVDMYLEYLKFCVVFINGRRYVCCSECYTVFNECGEPTPCLGQPIVVRPCSFKSGSLASR